MKQKDLLPAVSPARNGIQNDLDAWLTFLSVDDPAVIEQLIQQYPRFIPMYEDVYEMCKNTERVMSLFSKELKILDQNTVQFMIDEMADEMKELQRTNKEILKKNEEFKEEVEYLKEELKVLRSQISKS